MPLVPMEIPSETVTVPNIWVMPPACLIASSAACARRLRPMLQGVMVE